ncbi:hypothetical protein BGHDH14_bgh03516 [Blumeria hordei DH14]|uniref:Ubiquinone biosynthesis O-methyltransferase, mitochondrial n=1 Tax=Blumeria graminis f. sp. hordei (strain DH14) TaxID=546991 RepID=N1J8R9_BLUG1|nr:hypothetical protein BGHDH14_bgh03516 [Blumeria hordei DH14]
MAIPRSIGSFPHTSIISCLRSVGKRYVLHQPTSLSRPNFRSLHQESSVNPSEVAHFNALASTWWDPHGPSRLLHLMNPLRHDFIAHCHATQHQSPSVGQKLRYLDVGCGGGIFAESAARLSQVSSVTAIDPSTEVLAVAKAHARRDPALKGKLHYQNTAIEDLATPASAADQYDILSLFEVIEHISHPAPFILRCSPFVKPGGWMVFSTIARTWISWFTTIAVAEYGIRIVPPGTHDWQKYINEEELRTWFQQQGGWHNPQVMGVVYIPGIGWRPVNGSERACNYFFAIQKQLQ